MRDVLSEFTHALNMDTLKPTFGRIVGISALQAIYKVRLYQKAFLLYAGFSVVLNKLIGNILIRNYKVNSNETNEWFKGR